MRGNDKPKPATQRPLASEAEIQAMHDKAAVHQLAADKKEAQAQHELAGAKRMADDMVTNARAEAHRIVQQAQEQAAAHERQADEHAKELRAVRDTEVRRAQFWASLAGEEAAKAGLSPAAPTGPMPQIPDGEVRDA